MNKYIKYNQQPSKLLMRAFSQHTPSSPDFTLLDVGCNTGENLNWIHNQYPQAKYYGVDILPDAVSQARQRCPYATILCDNIEDMIATGNECFDYILLLDVLQHLNNPLKVLQEMKKLLKPDGIIIATIPNLMHASVLKPLLEQGLFTYSETGLLDYDHKHLFTFAEIVNMFKEANLHTVIQAYSIEISDQLSDFIRKLSHISYLDKWQFTTFEYIIAATN